MRFCLKWRGLSISDSCSWVREGWNGRFHIKKSLLRMFEHLAGKPSRWVFGTWTLVKTLRQSQDTLQRLHLLAGSIFVSSVDVNRWRCHTWDVHLRNNMMIHCFLKLQRIRELRTDEDKGNQTCLDKIQRSIVFCLTNIQRWFEQRSYLNLIQCQTCPFTLVGCFWVYFQCLQQAGSTEGTLSAALWSSNCSGLSVQAQSFFK